MKETATYYQNRNPGGSPDSVLRELGKAPWVEEWRTAAVFLRVSGENELRLYQVGARKADTSTSVFTI